MTITQIKLNTRAKLNVSQLLVTTDMACKSPSRLQELIPSKVHVRKCF